MASETVHRVLEAEKAAQARISGAKASGEKIVAQAEEYAERVMTEKMEQAEKDAEKIRAENRLKIEEYRTESAERFAAEKAEIIGSAERNLQLAADAVIDSLFG